MFYQEDKNRYIINLLNYQQELPNIPVDGTNLKIFTGGNKPGSLTVVPDGAEIKYKADGQQVEFVVPKLKDYLMLELKCK